jgi:hypothetical protein
MVVQPIASITEQLWVSRRAWCKKKVDGAREAAQDPVALQADEGVSHLLINRRYRFGADPGGIGDSAYRRHAGDAGGALRARECGSGGPARPPAQPARRGAPITC